MTTLTPSPNSTKLALIYIPTKYRDRRKDGGKVMTFWNLYTMNGVRFTPDLLTNNQLMELERNARIGCDANVAYRYW